jgi:hypothetical protein
MKTQVILTIMNRPVEPDVRPPATMTMIFGIQNPPRPPVPGQAANDTRTTRSDPLASPNASAKFREEIPHRYKAPFNQTRWHHGGINE